MFSDLADMLKTPQDRDRLLSILVKSFESSGVTLLNEPLGAIRIEFANFLKSLSRNEFTLFTNAYTHSFTRNTDSTLMDFIIGMLIYKKYAEFVMDHRNSQLSLVRFLFADAVVEKYKSVSKWVHERVQEESACLEEVLCWTAVYIGLQYPWIDYMAADDTLLILNRLAELLGPDLQKGSKQAAALFITELLQEDSKFPKTAQDLEVVSVSKVAKTHLVERSQKLDGRAIQRFRYAIFVRFVF